MTVLVKVHELLLTFAECSLVGCRELAAAPYKTCEKHYNRSRNRSRLRRAVRNAIGLCCRTTCTNPVTDGKTECAAHLRERSLRDWLDYQRVVYAYGGCCVCCGEANLPYLEVDHIENNGAEERRRLKTNGGNSFYRYLIRNNFPPGVQVLCGNCHNAKTRFLACHGRNWQ